MATRLGVTAVDRAYDGTFGVLIGVQGGRLVPVDLATVVGHTRTVDLDLYRIAQIFF
jgi:hypothetical protein